jgi:hypothetical protein
MLKKTVMAIVAAMVAAIALAAQPNKDARSKETSADKSSPAALSAPNRQNNGGADAAKPCDEPPVSHAPLHDPNWVLVIVGSITCLVVGWQSWETRKSAQATHKTVELQELAYNQWLNVEDWKTSITTGKGRIVLRLQFKVVNPTSFPLTITQAYFTVLGDIEGLIAETFCPPNVPLSVDESIAVTQQQATEWDRGILHMPFRAVISFAGVLKRPMVQQLNGILVCGYNSTVFVPGLPITPMPDGNGGDRNPK